MKIQKSFGLLVRKQRHRMDISQEVFAEKVGIHRTYVSGIELGKVTIGLDVAQKIAKALNMQLGKLISQAEKF